MDQVFNSGTSVFIDSRDSRGIMFVENFGSETTITGGDSCTSSITNYGSKVSINTGADYDIVNNWNGEEVTVNVNGSEDLIEDRGKRTYVNASADDETIFVFQGEYDTLYEGAPGIQVYNSGQSLTVDSGDGDDYLKNYGSSLTVLSGIGKDTVINGASNVFVYSGDGDDLIQNDVSDMIYDDELDQKANYIAADVLRHFLEACETDSDLRSILNDGANSPALSEYDPETAAKIADIMSKARDISREALDFHDNGPEEYDYASKILLPGCTLINEALSLAGVAGSDESYQKKIC